MKNKTKLLIGVAIVYSLLFTGCIPDEPEPQYITDFKMQIMQNLKNGEYYRDYQGADNNSEKVNKKEEVFQLITQEELNKKIAQFGIAQSKVNFLKTNSGF